MLELDLIILVFLLLLSAFFSGSETALISVDRLRIRQLSRKKGSSAKLIEEFQENPQKLLTTILIGNNLVNIAAAAIATNIAINVFQDFGIGIAVGIMTFLVLVLGEITPKTISFQNSERVALLVVKPIKALSIALSPLIWLLNGFTRIITRIVGKPESDMMTEQDIKTMVTMGAEVGAIHEKEKQMIHRIFKFNDLGAEDVMTPRSEIKAISSEATLEDVRAILAETPYSRLPVFGKSIDDIVGIFYTKDAWDYLADGNVKVKVREIARPVIFVHETKKIDKIMAEFQQTRNNMAIVVDDYGGVIGLVTLEDLLEEIVGEMVDESEEPLVVKTEANCFEADGRAPLSEINQALETNWKSENFDTISGFMIEKLDRIPEQDEEIRVGDFSLKAAFVNGPKVEKVRIKKVAPKKGR